MRFLVFFLIFGCSVVSHSKVVILEVSKEQAPVYKEASFDSEILIYLQKGKRLFGLKEPVEGASGIGLFHKVRLKKDFYAYVLDTDLKGFKPTGSLNKKRRSGLKRRNRRSRSSAINYSIPHAKAVGASFSYLRYAQSFQDTTEKSFEPFLGLRATGDWFNWRLPLDFQVLCLPKAPSLFKDFTKTSKGSVVLLDLSLPFEYRRGAKHSLYYGLGAVVNRYDFDLEFTGRGQVDKSSKTELGFSAYLGAGYRMGTWALKLEAKYYKISDDHMAFQVSLQRFL